MKKQRPLRRVVGFELRRVASKDDMYAVFLECHHTRYISRKPQTKLIRCVKCSEE